MYGVIYARYSSERQTEQSIEGQLRDCNAYAERYGIDVIQTYVDRAKTGRNDNRAGFQQMLKDSFRHNFECVLVWKIDRFGRSRLDITKNRAMLQQNGVKVISVMEPRVEGSQGIINEALLDGLAEYYSAELSEKVRRGMKESAYKCQYNGSGVPLGYVIRDKKYCLDPERAGVVNLIYDLYESGHGISEIVQTLKDKQFTRPNGQPLTYPVVRRILENEMYTGLYKWGEYSTPDGIPRIISDEQFERVQKKLSKNTKHYKKREEGVDYMLTGKIFCGHCGASMQGDSGTSKSGQIHYYYSCHNKKKSGSCKKRSIRKEYIEAEVAKIAKEVILRDDSLEEIADGLVRYQERQRLNNSALSLYNSQLSEVNTKLKNIMRNIESGIVPQMVMQQMVDLEQRKNDLQELIKREEVLKPVVPKDLIIFIFSKYKDGDYTDPVYQKKLFDTFLNKVIVYDDKLVVTFNYTEEDKELSVDRVEEAANEAISECSTSLLSAPPIIAKSNTSQNPECYIFILDSVIGVVESL